MIVFASIFLILAVTSEKKFFAGLLTLRYRSS